MAQLISSEEKKDLRREQITLLVKSYYEKLDFLHYEPLDLLIDKSLDLFLDSDLTIDEINEKMIDAIASRKKALDDRYDNDKVKANHETIYGKLEQVCRLLNQEGVDYQLAGALCGYIKYDQESDRCHDDIDFCINEEDLENFGMICEKLGLRFYDHRLNSPRVLRNGHPSGEHEIIAKDPESDFHIGVFAFERKEDGTVVSKGYYHDEDGLACVREEIYYPELANEIYGHEEVDFRGTPIVITPPEVIYDLKRYTNHEKDQHDRLFLEDKIDRDKYLRLQMLARDYQVIQHVPVEDIPNSNIHNRFNDDEDDLGLMLADDEFRKKEEATTSRKKEGAKVLMKTYKDIKQEEVDTTGEEGFISNTIITTLAIITFVLCFIGIAIIYLVQM